MRYASLLVVVLLHAPAAFAADSHRSILWDFEAGIEGWWANPWSGGEADVEPATGRYGDGLRGHWRDVPGSGNLVSPFLPEDAPWRSANWATISFWFKGDGSDIRVRLTVQTKTPDGELLSYTKPVPMDSEDWRRFSFDLRTFWNREKVPMDPGRIVRILIAGGGTHECAIDHIALEVPQLPLPLELTSSSGVELAPNLSRTERGNLLLGFDPAALGAAAKVAATATFADGGSATTQEYVPLLVESGTTLSWYGDQATPTSSLC